MSTANSVSWHGHSPFEEFWNLENKDGLYLKLSNMLKSKSAAFKMLEHSDILSAIANINFKITETASKLSSTVTFQIVLNTSAEIQKPKIVIPTTTSRAAVTNAKSDPVSPTKANFKSNSGNKNSHPNKFDEAVLERHNIYRKKHKAPALVYNKKISEISQDWANRLAEKDEFYHRPNNKYGENLYYSWSSNPNYQVPPNAAVDSWYSEIKYYNYSKNINIAQVGHFTQLVWKNSKELGIGLAKSKTNKFYVVCNYFPPGNVIGQFAENVLRPSKS